MKTHYIKRVGIYVTAGILLASFSVNTVGALGGVYDKAFYSSNNILNSNPEDIACIPSSVVLSGKDNRQKVFNFLKAKGLNNNQAVGVLANIQNESGYSPTRHEDGQDFDSGGYGIAQWTDSRRPTLKAYLEKKTSVAMVTQYYISGYGSGVSEANGFVPKNSATGELIPLADNDALLGAELEFLFEETTARKIIGKTAAHTSAINGAGEWESLKKSTSIEDATKIWLYNFERPRAIEQAAIDRTQVAKDLLPIVTGESGGSGSSSTGCADTTSGDVAALQATVKLYAWPEHHDPPYVTPKDEYKVAFEKNFKAGGYVGGIRYRGIDCGGFVTQVMIDSGFEKQYNDKKGPTGTQKIWLEANWQNLGTGDKIDTATLKPGDVAMKNRAGHTFMFAGTNIEGFGKSTAGWKGVASASLDERAPMAGIEPLTSGDYSWFRKKVVSHE